MVAIGADNYSAVKNIIERIFQKSQREVYIRFFFFVLFPCSPARFATRGLFAETSNMAFHANRF